MTPFRLAVVPGAQPQRWVRTWHERLPDVPLELVHLAAADAADALLEGRADAALLRLPVDREHLDAIPLYTETTVVLVPTDHLLASTGDDDEVAVGDLADEVVVVPQDDVVGWPSPPTDAHRPATTADAVELVAAGVGVLVVPQSLARLHHRKDLTYRTLTDVPTSSVALAWHRDRTTDLVEEMIGIVRGRTANSSRGRGATAPPAPAGEPESSV
ncbi:MAG: LysR family transcriptional regulator [Cellulomonadaceae bacterium]|nr:LysR family transcriptional regulator [Cellulomonadaceae bacterium]